MAANVAKDVDEYIAAVPESDRQVLQDLRKTIKAAAPETEELISYGIPTFRYRGRPLVHFAAFKDHLSFVTTRESLVEQFRDRLAGHKTSGTTIQFTFQHPIPADVVEGIVKARVKEND